MIKHVVFCNFKPEATDEQRREVVEELKAMRGKIGEIRDLAVGLNVIKSDRSWDLALVSSFDSLADLDAYANHPAHLPLKKKLGSLSKELGVVDFEYRE